MLTQKEVQVLKALQKLHDESYDEMPGFSLVYLDNGINTEDKTTRGVLGSLEKKGYYVPEDGYAWGWVKNAVQNYMINEQDDADFGQAMDIDWQRVGDKTVACGDWCTK